MSSMRESYAMQARREHTADFYARIAPGTAMRPEWGHLILRPCDGHNYGRIRWVDRLSYQRIEPRS